MSTSNNDLLRYLAISPSDEEWGMVVTTAGYQFIPPGSRYPLSQHPDAYAFQPQTGRTLNEYQLVYITKGSGTFLSRSCKEQRIQAGTVMLLFPGEWHSYYPDRRTGWNEYWVGFRGKHIDKKVERHFFTKKEPLFRIGFSATVVGLYDDILKFAALEKSGYQQMLSGIALHLLGSVYYMKRNQSFTNTYIVDKINQARALMREQADNPSPPGEIASCLGLGYSWFRRMFKEYTGVSPAQYQQQLRLLRAKELLIHSVMNVSEIAYALTFENSGQFSTFFKKKEGITPTEFRERYQ